MATILNLPGLNVLRVEETDWIEEIRLEDVAGQRVSLPLGAHEETQ